MKPNSIVSTEPTANDYALLWLRVRINLRLVAAGFQDMASAAGKARSSLDKLKALMEWLDDETV